VVADEEPIEDPLNQITLTEAKALAPDVEVGSEIRLYRDTSPLAVLQRNWPSRSSSRRSRAERDTVSRSMRTARRKC